jgi:hypothetical protein
MTAVGPESAVVRRTGQPERRTLPAHWPMQGNKKARVTNSVLETSQLILHDGATSRVTAPPDPSLSAGQVSGTMRREPPKCEWTCRMIALTCDFHVFASRVATGFSAVFFSSWYIAQARYMRALFHLFICHYDSVLSKLLSPITTAS